MKCKNNAKLAKHWFKKLIETRMNAINLSDFPFQTLDDLEKYCDSTVSPVYYLIIESALNSEENNNQKLVSKQRLVLDHIASHLGRGQGISNILRGVSHNAKHNRCYIPSELLIKYKTSHEDFLRVKQLKNVKDVCFEMASNANQHIETAQTLIKQIDKNQRLIFLPLVSVKNYLNRLEKCDFNIFEPKLMQRQGLLPFTLWFNSKFL
jgi:NADH dehydrogenase [ubiquinone] 1 alpha subcomplex assembly factor 6